MDNRPVHGSFKEVFASNKIAIYQHTLESSFYVYILFNAFLSCLYLLCKEGKFWGAKIDA